MTKTWPGRVAEGFRSLATPAAPRVWRHAAAADDRSSFFFAWSPADAPPRSVGDRDSRIDRRLRAGWRRAARDSAFDVDRILALNKSTGERCESEPVDDLDDSMLRVSCTKLFDRSRRESDPERYVDPFSIPFLALSTRRTFAATGVRLGDFATAMNPRTGRWAHAIIGDEREVPGAEPSPALAMWLDLATADRAIYLIHPGSGLGQGTIPTNDAIHRQGERLFKTQAWGVILAEFAQSDF